MRNFGSIAALAFAAAATQVSAQPVSIPQVDPVAFEVVNVTSNPVIEHKQSGAQCPINLGGLSLAAAANLRPGDGTNVGCQYDRTDENGVTRLSVYIYTFDGIDAVREYHGAKAGISQIAEATALTVTEQKEAGQTCFGTLIPQVGEQVIARNALDGLAQEDSPVSLGSAVYNFDVPEVNGNPARQETSLLSVYQAGDWVVKTRVTLPGQGADSAAAACNYAGLATLTQVPLISRK